MGPLVLLIALLPLWEAWAVATGGAIAAAHCNGLLSGSFYSLGLWLGRTFGGAAYAHVGYAVLAGCFGLVFVYIAYGMHRRFLAGKKLDAV